MKIALLGDSHMEALGPLLAGKLRAQGHEPRFTAKRGYSVKRMLDEGLVGPATRGADFVVVELGGNDRPGADYEAQLDRLLGQVGVPKERVLWVGPPTAIREPYRTIHSEVARRQNHHIGNIREVRWYDSRLATGSGHRTDGVHFTMPAYRIWADAIYADGSLARQLATVGHATTADRLEPIVGVAIAATVVVGLVALFASGGRRGKLDGLGPSTVKHQKGDRVRLIGRWARKQTNVRYGYIVGTKMDPWRGDVYVVRLPDGKIIDGFVDQDLRAAPFALRA